MSNLLNRPAFEGKPLEGPEPFLQDLTMTEGLAMGVSNERLDTRVHTNQEIARLALFRTEYPHDFTTNTVIYPQGAREYARQLNSQQGEDNE